jgi:hypothetical protein
LNSALITRIRKRATSRRRIDGPLEAVRRQGSLLPAPAPAELVAEAEHKMGFELPPFLRTLYLEIANGGFGPGYGLTGLDASGWLDPETGLSLPDQYLSWWSDARAFGEQIPERILPICDWGCCARSYIDCNTPNAEMIFASDAGVAWDDFRERIGFEQWMEDWAGGVNLHRRATKMTEERIRQ